MIEVVECSGDVAAGVYMCGGVLFAGLQVVHDAFVIVTCQLGGRYLTLPKRVQNASVTSFRRWRQVLAVERATGRLDIT